MGIPSYFVYIVKNHRSILKKYNKSLINVDNLYLDSNSLIYEAINSIKFTNKNNFEKDVLESICIKIKTFIEIIEPKKKVFIAFDGVAPVAKLSQQKNRRYKSWFQQEIFKSINPEIKEKEWNPAAITPGTAFMEKLNNKISEYFSIKKDNLEYIISASNDVGEGEHKIYQYIRKNKEYHKNTSTVIYGLDADLIMLTLNHLEYSENLYLFRETPFFIKNIDDTLEENSYYLLDIPEFGNKLVCEMIDRENIENINYNKKINIINDYVFICFLLGNDFMPHFPSLNIRTNGIDILLNIYNKVNNNLNNFITTKKGINWGKVREIVEILSKNEEMLIKEEYKIRKKMELKKNNKQSKEDEFINTPIYVRKTENYINPYESGWQYRYYKSLFDIEIDKERKKQICINYLSILEWNYYYYNSECIDWRFKYNYNYPPLFQDLIEYIPFLNTRFVENKLQDPIDNKVQLAYVLPRDSLNLIPNINTNNLLTNLNEYYKLDYDFEWAFCRYFWECHVKAPELKLDILEKILL
jgi:5'-3' exonuclease